MNEKQNGTEIQDSCAYLKDEYHKEAKNLLFLLGLLPSDNTRKNLELSGDHSKQTV